MALRNDSTLGPDSAGLGAWAVLFGSLCAAGGHGLFLLAAVWLEIERGRASDAGAARGMTRFLDVLVGVGQGRLGAAAVAWLVIAPLLAIAVLCLRRPLMQSRGLGTLALGGVLVTAGAFGVYFATAAGPS
jgi:hypothetical protein